MRSRSSYIPLSLSESWRNPVTAFLSFSEEGMVGEKTGEPEK